MASKVYPISQTITWDRVGLVPPIKSLLVTVAEFETVEFVMFYIERISGNVDWLDSSMSGQYLPVTRGNIPFNFINLDTLEAGNHQSKIDILISNSEVELRKITATINFNISSDPPFQILTDQSTYNVIYNRETDEISGDLAIGITNNTDDVLLKFWQNDAIFADAENFVDGFTLSEDSANLLATNPFLPATGSVIIPCKILKQTDEFVNGFNINLTVVDGGIVVNPENLDFEIFKGMPEKSEILTVTNPLGLDFEITEFPTWLSLSAESGNTDLAITVTTVTTALPVGIYTENIKIVCDGDITLIPVTLVLKSFIVIDETVDFCLDLPEVLVNRKMEDGKFVKITLTAIYHVLGIENVWQKVYQVPYFMDVAKFALGEKLHRHFPRAKRHFFAETELEFMKIISASIKVEELNSSLGILYVENLNNIKLFPGKKPNAFPLLSSALFRKKNKNAIIFTSEAVGETVILKNTDEIDLGNPLVLGGTVIQFYDFPKVYSPVHLQWENQNLCPDWFTLTGDYKITPDYNHIYARNIFNSQNEKYDFTKVKTLTINTGMILAKDRNLISEIIESKLSFIKIENTIYRAFSITKKNVELDSTEELIARDLEFLIVE